MEQAAVIVIVVVACIGAYVLSIVPVVPSALLVPAGAVGVGLISGFDAFPWWFWAGQAIIAAASMIIDNVAQAVGVRRLGGSRRAMIGGMVGVIVGPVVLAPMLNILALLIGPPIGAVAGTLLGEWSFRRRASPAVASAVEPGSGVAASPAGGGSMSRIGVGALLAWAVGTAVRLVLVTVQVAWLILEL